MIISEIWEASVLGVFMGRYFGDGQRQGVVQGCRFTIFVKNMSSHLSILLLFPISKAAALL